MHNVIKQPAAPQYFVGMMSGTSLDGIDAVLARYEPTAENAWQIVSSHSQALPNALRSTLYDLNFSRRVEDELNHALLAANALSDCYAEAFFALLAKTPISSAEIVAIGAHGQTIRHQPQQGYTCQLLNGSLLAARTRVNVACDFRQKDIALGGQGAPLAPLFHCEMFKNPRPLAVVNIGGISNISLLYPDRVLGFDCGPGNGLLDLWIQQHLKRDYDENGSWAATGECDQTLLDACLADLYFQQAAPKSTGRDYFSADWLYAKQQASQRINLKTKPENVMRTLAALTAYAIADCVPADIKQLMVVGGGAKNPLLLADIAMRLRSQKKPAQVRSSAEIGIDPQQIEALGFAMLAKRSAYREKADTPAITGASRASVLGAWYFAD